MSRLEQIMHSREIWKDQINPQLARIMQNKTSFLTPYNVQSRNLTDLIRRFSGSYYYGETKWYFTKAVTTLVSLITNKNIRVYGHYATISSEQAETYTLNDFINSMRMDNDEDTLNLHIYHIPKGKTYIRKLLDNDPTLQRISNMETLCINNAFHFLRVYKGFGRTQPDDITIITDQITDKLLTTFLIMLPNLYDINVLPVPETDDKDFIEAMEARNTKITALRNIFTLLYQYYRTGSNDPEYTASELTQVKESIHDLIDKFIALFDFESTAIKSFTENLAKARNNVAEKHYKNELNSAKSSISRLEKELADAYIKASNAERELNSIRVVSENDIQPFMKTLQNTKAIEVLETSDLEMKLRITVPLQYFTESDFEAYEKNPSSEYNKRFANMPTVQRILHKIFVTREYKLLVQSIIKLRINNSSYYSEAMQFSAQSHSDTNFTEFPNPHLYYHDCWSKAKTEMQKNICEGNFELVIMQMLAATQSVNVAENASFVNGLLRSFTQDSHKRLITIIDKDNNKYTYKEIVDHEYDLEKAEKQAKQNAELEAAKKKLEETPKEGYNQIVLEDNGEDWEIPTPTEIPTNPQVQVRMVDPRIISAEQTVALPEDFYGTATQAMTNNTINNYVTAQEAINDETN